MPLLGGGATTPYLPAVADLLTERGITHHRTLDESADKLGGLILDFSAARTPPATWLPCTPWARPR